MGIGPILGSSSLTLLSCRVYHQSNVRENKDRFRENDSQTATGIFVTWLQVASSTFFFSHLTTRKIGILQF